MKVTELFELLSKLSNVHRYSTNFLVKPESVLEHTASVSMIVLILSLELESRFGVVINYKDAFAKSILHDIEESETGDIPRTTKHCNPTVSESLYLFEVECASVIFNNLEVKDQSIIDYWHNSKDGLTGLLVSIGDLLSVTYKLWTEISLLNNYSLVPVARESVKNYQKLNEKIQGIDDLAPEVRYFLYKIIDQAQFIAKSLTTVQER